jgi:hypothetical protein
MASRRKNTGVFTFIHTDWSDVVKARKGKNAKPTAQHVDKKAEVRRGYSKHKRRGFDAEDSDYHPPYT